MKNTLFIFFTFISISCFAQFSKTHYIPPLSSGNSLSVTPQEQYIYISTPSITPVNVKINAIGVGITNVTVSQNDPREYYINSGPNTQLMASTGSLNTPLTDKGYIIEAESLIYVAVRVTAGSTNAQAGSLVSKGLSALGKEFRVGAFINTGTTNTSTPRFTFLSILATENNTLVEFKDIKPGVLLLNNPSVGNVPPSIILNRGQSYILATEDNSTANKDGLIGTLVKASKPIALNCGSFGGTNGDINNNLDLGFDQIVPVENIGKEYIFVRGLGQNITERPLIVAHEDDTEIFINEVSAGTLGAGKYLAIDGSLYEANGTMYVRTTKPTFAYQSVGGPNQPNQEMFFVPPLNCSTPNIVNNIPLIEKIGSLFFTKNSRLNVVTKIDASLQIRIDGVLYDITGLPSAISILPSKLVTTLNAQYIAYSLTGLTGNIGVFSNQEVYVSFFGSNSAATYGGYYSGFDLKPEIISTNKVSTTSRYMPDIELNIAANPLNNTFQWIFNGVDIDGEISDSYTPTLSKKGPGYYQVRKFITSCGTTILSDEIPVSDRPIDTDGDGVNNNIDIDNDNDGITNCIESYGNQNIDISNPMGGTIAVENYSNLFIGTVNTFGKGTPGTITGNYDGSVVLEIPAGLNNSVSYKMTFAQPISLGIEYITTANATDLLNADAEYIINSDVDKTITVLNPTDQLLIDTNYDGIYESGITEFSSFEIRFKLKSITSLPAGTGTFKFLSYLTNTIRFTQKNLSDDTPNKSSLKFFAVCVPKDTDQDGISDQLDIDSDNDGIPDAIEAQGSNFITNTAVDLNKDGLSDAYGNAMGIVPIDTDLDASIAGVPDYLDLDSDNDGIYDLVESGSGAIDTNNDGIVDGAKSSFGSNGLSSSVETLAGSGILKYTIQDTDGDGIKNYIEIDSDNDFCNDVIEAGFLDPNNDGFLGSNLIKVNTSGVVTSGTAYTRPNLNYTIAAPIIITTEPNITPTCELETTRISIADNGGNSYQWQICTNGITWSDLVNNAVYSGVQFNTISISRVTTAMNGYKYRVALSKIGNSCGLISDETILSVLALPNMNTPINLVQCDDDTDGISDFNLIENNHFISTNLNDTLSYFTTPNGARNNDLTLKILNPSAYRSGNGTVWVRVENSTGCFNTAQLNLIISTTQIPKIFSRMFESCDDHINSTQNDTDGISLFDFSSTTTDIKALLPSPSTTYDIKYYGNESDALSESNEITNTTNFRNTDSPFTQQIWVRIESTLNNSCYGLGPHITLRVNPKPNIDTNEDHSADALVCSNLPSFFVKLNAGLLDGSPIENYSYIWSKDNEVLTGNSGYTLDVNTMGNYTVTATNLFGCSRTRNIKVSASDIAQIDSVDIIDLTETNSVTINVSGSGNYSYSLDAATGPFQSSNFFNNLTAGIHEVFINDTNGCGTIQKTIAVLAVPKFFTPNGDGFNDYWNLKGINTNLNSKSIIYIFDRFGKLLKQIDPSGLGWDGTFNGLPLAADDFWFTITLENGRELKGHFTLKR
jgi:gliding motility-associated-like protein